MFPVLLYVYRRLAIREEREVAAEFGPVWDALRGRDAALSAAART